MSKFSMLALAILGSSSFAVAQDSQILPRPEFPIGPAGPASGYHGWYPHHSSTLQEGMLRGAADFIRSSGEGELLHYESLRSREAAIEHSLDNAVRRLETRQTPELMGLQHRETVRRLQQGRRTSTHSSTRADTEPADPLARAERRANGKLRLARSLLEQGRGAAAQRWFQEIVDEFPDTTAARQAEQLLSRR